MPDSKKQPKASGYNTNLAGEFYVLACLHRRGVTANLTLGNKKGVDIVVVRSNGDVATVEVKAVAGKFDWTANNLVTTSPDKHFVALVVFRGQDIRPRNAGSPSLDHALQGGRTIQTVLQGPD